MGCYPIAASCSTKQTLASRLEREWRIRPCAKATVTGPRNHSRTGRCAVSGNARCDEQQDHAHAERRDDFSLAFSRITPLRTTASGPIAFSACCWRRINSLVLAGSSSDVSMSLPNSFSGRGYRSFIGSALRWMIQARALACLSDAMSMTKRYFTSLLTSRS